MTTIRDHVAELATAAERGTLPTDADFARLPSALVGPVRDATNRIAALALAGDQMAARRERVMSVDEVRTAMALQRIDPASQLPGSTLTADERGALLGATGDPSGTRAVIDSIPRI